MPRIASAKKRQRQTVVRTARNRTQRSALRSAIKRVRSAESAEAANEAFKSAESLIDRAGRKKLIHPNAADRTKRRLARLVAAKQG